jgi:PIN domain nuclease of toxin-antitoxin system
MKVLLDTHAFLWWIADSDRLSRRAREILGEPGNT